MLNYSSATNHRESRSDNKKLYLIWDLDGEFATFRRHMAELWVISSIGWGWLGWSSTLILSGDILADRGSEGFQILREIERLRKEAEGVWWNIVVLAGNHEEVMIWYFMGHSFNCHTDVQNPLQLSRDYPAFEGICEALAYGENYHEVLQNMNSTPEGRAVLREICKMSLLYKVGNTLHFHTPPGLKMLDMINDEYRNSLLKWAEPMKALEISIENINHSWQTLLEKILLQPENFTEQDKKAYLYYASAFLNTANGTAEAIKARWYNPDDYPDAIVPSTHSLYTILKSSWVEKIFHGHTDTEVRIDWFQVIWINRVHHTENLIEVSTLMRNSINRLQDLPDREKMAFLILESMKEIPESFRMRKVRIPWWSISYLRETGVSRDEFIRHVESLFPTKDAHWNREMQFSDTGREFRFEYCKISNETRTPIYTENPTAYDQLMEALEKEQAPN